MATIRVPLSDLCAGERHLDQTASRYLARVLRLGVGDSFLAFDPAARLEAPASIVRQQGGALVCQLEAPLPAARVATHRIALIQALSKGDRIDRVVRDATQLGVTSLTFVETARTVLRLGARAVARRQRWSKIALESARQCERGDVPDLTGPMDLDAALLTTRNHGVRLVLDARSGQALARCLEGWRPAQGLALLVGPEGGLEPAELEMAKAHGFTPTRFGERVLRTETAPIALLGAVLLAAEQAEQDIPDAP